MELTNGMRELRDLDPPQNRRKHDPLSDLRISSDDREDLGSVRGEGILTKVYGYHAKIEFIRRITWSPLPP